jgi:hypothetical protein
MAKKLSVYFYLEHKEIRLAISMMVAEGARFSKQTLVLGKTW